MVFVHNVSEIYQLGIGIEKNGKAFYAACARDAKLEMVRKLCEELSAWEEEHVALFENLKSQVPGNSRFLSSEAPDDEFQLYLKAAADTDVFIVNSDINVVLATVNTPAKMLATALDFEKDSVVLYTTMTRLVPDNLGRMSLEKIIGEELKHISIIVQKMAMVNK